MCVCLCVCICICVYVYVCKCSYACRHNSQIDAHMIKKPLIFAHTSFLRFYECMLLYLRMICTHTSNLVHICVSFARMILYLYVLYLRVICTHTRKPVPYLHKLCSGSHQANEINVCVRMYACMYLIRVCV